MLNGYSEWVINPHDWFKKLIAKSFLGFLASYSIRCIISSTKFVVKPFSATSLRPANIASSISLNFLYSFLYYKLITQYSEHL